MANFRRNKPATRTPRGKLTREREAKFETFGYGRFYRKCPKWHNLLFHSRPTRRDDAAIAHGIVTETIDSEEALWLPRHRPHKYYW